MRGYIVRLSAGIFIAVLLLLAAGQLATGQGEGPISGATVEVVGTNGHVETKTGADGTFIIREGLGSGTYSVYVRAKGFISAQISDVKIEADKETDLGDIILDPSGIIRGRVVDPDGNPVGGVLVVVSKSDGEQVGSVFSGPDGSFELNTDLETGTYTVEALPFTFEGFKFQMIRLGIYTIQLPIPGRGSVFKEGLSAGVVRDVRVTQGEATTGVVVRLGLSGIISGRVTDEDGNPAPGILVVAFQPGQSEPNGFFATTDSNGNYRMASNLPTGVYNVTLLFPRGYVWNFAEGKRVSVEAGKETKNVDFVLKRSGIISGEVVFNNGLPAPNATVIAVTGDGKYFGFAKSGIDGKFRIDSGLGTGKYNVVAMLGGAFSQPVEVNVKAGKEVSNVKLVLQGTAGLPEALIEGVVKDTEGNPILGASVRTLGSVAVTDKNGKYKLVVTLPREEETLEVEVTASAPGFEEKTSKVTVRAGASETLNFILKPLPSGILKGRVLGRGLVQKKEARLSISLSSGSVATGETVTISGSISPARGGEVTILVSKDGGGFEVLDTVGLANGRFSLDFRPAEPGRYVFKATWPGDEEYSPAESPTVTLEVSAAPPEKVTPEISISLSKTSANVGDSVTISGSIEPFKGETKVIIVIASPSATNEYEVETTDGKFSYTFKVDVEGTWTVKARVPSGDVYNEAASASVSLSVSAPEEEKKCIIATVTFGSEVEPEVNFLRSFRDNLILSTYTGSRFYVAFDAFYYSWSTPVAKFIEANPTLKPLVKALIYPLLGILQLTSYLATPLFQISPEAGAVFAGFVASSLMGVVYFAPLLALAYLAVRRGRAAPRVGGRTLRINALAVAALLGLILLGYVAKNPVLTTIATSAYVLSTISLSSLALFKAAEKMSKFTSRGILFFTFK